MATKTVAKAPTTEPPRPRKTARRPGDKPRRRNCRSQDEHEGRGQGHPCQCHRASALAREIGEDPRTRQGVEQHRTEAVRACREPPCDDQGDRARPGRGAAAAGVLLRYARPGLEPRRPGRPGPANPGRTRRHGRQAAPGGSGHDRRRASSLGELQDRGGCDAGRIRVLGVVQGRLHRQGGARRDRRRDAA